MDHLTKARELLSANNLEAGLPGREELHSRIFNFLYERLKKRPAGKRGLVDLHTSNSLYICGVPGTGKTATFKSVEYQLKKRVPHEIDKFQSLYINAQHLSAPNKIYTEIWRFLTNQTLNPDKAQEKLNGMFSRDNSEPEMDKSSRPSRRSQAQKKVDPDSFKLITIDEFDLMFEQRRQNVLYSLFDWPTSSESRVILIAIANAMDLQERCMRGRIASRMGWEKVIFEPYSCDDLTKIIKARCGEALMNKCFDKNALIVSTKRIGRTTGDARRILDTCRLAIDKAIERKKQKVTTAIIDEVGFQCLDQHRKKYISTASHFELAILKSILRESARVGDENVETAGVFNEASRMLAKIDKIMAPSDYERHLNSLAAYSLIYIEHGKPLFKRPLYIKDCGQAFTDLIRTQPLSTSCADPLHSS